MIHKHTRRGFLRQTGNAAGAAMIGLSLPQFLSACKDATEARKQGGPFKTLTADEAAELGAIAARIVPTTDTPGARACVVVVDDEPLVGRAIRRALRGHDVQVFTSGEEAVERLCSDEPFDVVFCDLMMPDLSGMEVFARVSEQCPEMASRFVFMTGGAFTPEAREFLKQSTLACLEKPFELRQIRDLVRERAEPVD